MKQSLQRLRKADDLISKAASRRRCRRRRRLHRRLRRRRVCIVFILNIIRFCWTPVRVAAFLLYGRSDSY